MRSRVRQRKAQAGAAPTERVAVRGFEESLSSEREASSELEDHSFGSMKAPEESAGSSDTPLQRAEPAAASIPIQRKVGFEFELAAIRTRELLARKQQVEEKSGKEELESKKVEKGYRSHPKASVLVGRTGYDVTADVNAGSGHSEIEFVTEAIDENATGAATTLFNLGGRIHNDIADIVRASAKEGESGKLDWVGLDKVSNFGGNAKDQVWPMAGWDGMYGQLQMTGGVSVDKLGRLLSGSALGARPAPPDHKLVTQGDKDAFKEATKQDLLNNFYAQTNINRFTGKRANKQLVYRTALSQVQALGAFDSFWWGAETAEGHFASLVTLMAMTPISLRLGPVSVNEVTGLLLAKTDFAKIAQLAANASGGTLSQAQLRTALVNTINAHVDTADQVTIGSSVYPAGFNDKGTTFTDLNIATWCQGVIPTKSKWGIVSSDWRYTPGVDRSTGANFPGTRQQKAGLRAFGTFGSKTDPGNKIIMEFRNFGSLHTKRLPVALQVLGEYMKSGIHEE